jgi:hypothetical protein
MTAMPATRIDADACPGPVPTSLEHAERCRACGKCGTIVWPPAGGLAGSGAKSVN